MQAGLLLSWCILCTLAAALSPAKKASPPPPSMRRALPGTALQVLLQDIRFSKFTAALMVGGCKEARSSSRAWSPPCPPSNRHTPLRCLQNTGLEERLSKASFVATILAPTGGWQRQGGRPPRRSKMQDAAHPPCCADAAFDAALKAYGLTTREAYAKNDLLVRVRAGRVKSMCRQREGALLVHPLLREAHSPTHAAAAPSADSEHTHRAREGPLPPTQEGDETGGAPGARGSHQFAKAHSSVHAKRGPTPDYSLTLHLHCRSGRRREGH